MTSQRERRDNNTMQESSSQSKPSASLGSSDQKSDPPLRRIILCSAPPTSPPTKKGVPVPPLLQDLFGIDYLPRLPQIEQDTESIQSELSLEGTLEEGEQEVVEHDYLTPLSADAIQASFERKKMRLSVGKLASRVANVKQRRKQRRRTGQTLDSIEDSFTSEKKTERPPRKSVHNVNAPWIQKQQARLEQHKSTLVSVQQETLAVEARAKSLSTHLQKVQQEVAELEKVLSRSIIELQNDTRELQQTKTELKRLEVKRNRATRGLQETASSIRYRIPPLSRTPPHRPLDDDPLLNPLLATPETHNLDALSTHSEPNLPHAKWAPTTLHKVSSFIRIHDLDMKENSTTNSSLSEGSLGTSVEDMFYIDKDVTTVLTALAQFGHDLATDESERFTPALNTEKLLTRNSEPDPSWPIQPWHAASGKDVLVWTGSVGHNGHGCELPVYKARGIICTAPRNVVELVMDSSRVGEYNKMSQGRNDILHLQKGIDTTADESEYGIPGEAKIVKSLNKPPLIRRKIEMLSLIYARRLEEADGYLVVSRSVWEDSSATPQTLANDTLRSEILLGVNILRPVVGPAGTQYCEMTTITHTHTSGVVPDALLRKIGPGQAAKFLEEIQAIFSKR